jgi:hypothetical protein
MNKFCTVHSTVFHSKHLTTTENVRKYNIKNDHYNHQFFVIIKFFCSFSAPMFAKSQQAVFLKALIDLKKTFLHIIIVYYSNTLLKLVYIIHYICGHHI